VVEYRDSKLLTWSAVKGFLTSEAADAYQRTVAAGLPARVVPYAPEEMLKVATKNDVMKLSAAKAGVRP